MQPALILGQYFLPNFHSLVLIAPFFYEISLFISCYQLDAVEGEEPRAKWCFWAKSFNITLQLSDSRAQAAGGAHRVTTVCATEASGVSNSIFKAGNTCTFELALKNYSFIPLSNWWYHQEREMDSTLHIPLERCCLNFNLYLAVTEVWIYKYFIYTSRGKKRILQEFTDSWCVYTGWSGFRQKNSGMLFTNLLP